ncbi:MAG: hypothetical protein ACE5HM_07190, partial [Acidiferrobacterales bacterium]
VAPFKQAERIAQAKGKPDGAQARKLRVRRQDTDVLSENLLRQALSEGTGWVCRRSARGSVSLVTFLSRQESNPRTGSAPRSE